MQEEASVFDEIELLMVRFNVCVLSQPFVPVYTLVYVPVES